MKCYKVVGIGILLVMMTGCASRSETLDQSNTVTVSKNGEVSEQTTIAPSTVDESQPTEEQHSLAKEAIKEIEATKQIILDDQYMILVQGQTADSIDINIRHSAKNVATNYGFFRYYKSTKILEELDMGTGNYKPINTM